MTEFIAHTGSRLGPWIIYFIVGFKVLMARTMDSTVFYNVETCSSRRPRRFGSPASVCFLPRLHFDPEDGDDVSLPASAGFLLGLHLTLNMESMCSSETSVPPRTALLCVPEDYG
jgi:hypothetical protein